MDAPRGRPHRLQLGILGRDPLARIPVRRLPSSSASSLPSPPHLPNLKHCTVSSILPPPRSFNPIFLLPVCETLDLSTPPEKSTPISRTPGRRTGTGSAAISPSASSARNPTQRVPIVGFRRVGLLSMILSTGHLPLIAGSTSARPETLEEVRRRADRPVVVFPECTTSNGRALLRFAEVFRGVKVPVMKYKVFVMCVRYVFVSSL